MSRYDGPYIFYSDEKIIRATIADDDARANVVIDTFDSGDDVPIHVRHADASLAFSTTLRSSLNVPATYYPAHERLLAISDIEGEFESFCELLIGNRVMSKDFEWTFDNNDLVLNGDFFDRGPQVTECLWLIYHLEREAEKAGGRVHFILGNHEVMNMTGDLRYLNKKYLRSAELLHKDYRELYTPSTVLGRWLATKNVVEQIGGTIFVHGGISQAMVNSGLSLEEINTLCRPYLFDPTARKSSDEKLQLAFGTSGPLWYRGYFLDSLEQPTIESITAHFGAERIVVGHTTVDHVSSLHNGRVIGIDTRHAEGSSEALLIEGSSLYRVAVDGKRTAL